MKDKIVNFGFKKVVASAKPKMVQEVFSSVATKYDVMNDIMSAGIHRAWKRRFVELICQSSTEHLLDVGGGTGDIAARFLNKGGKLVTVVDINKHMLEQGQKKYKNTHLDKYITWQVEDAENLPFEDNSFSVYSISFCLRNVTNTQKALQEAYRVLKPGGRFFCLEFSKVNNSLLSQLYDIWSFHFIPNIGNLITKDKHSYQYLVESIRKFYTQEELKSIIKDVGFIDTYYENLTNGIACIHSGLKV